MHGEINLTSKLGRGTKTTFWIPFNKPQSPRLGSTLQLAIPVPESSRSTMAISVCFSAPQSVVGDDLHNAAPIGLLDSEAGSLLEPILPKAGAIEELAQQEVDRKTVHVLVVEDKYVVIPSYVCVDQVADPLLQCYQPADCCQDSQKARILRERGVGWQGSSRLPDGRG